MESVGKLLEDYTTLAMTKFAEDMDEIVKQRELQTKAWMEVASRQTLDWLAVALQEYKDTQTRHIQEFREEKLQELQSDLDSFQYHAQEILHTGIFGKDVPNSRAQYAPPRSKAVPVEEEPKTPDYKRERLGLQSPSTPIEMSSQTPGTATQRPTATKRWANVDYAAFTTPRQGTSLPTSLLAFSSKLSL